MTTDIAITLIILLITVILFFTELLRVDLIALLVMGSLVVTGILKPAEALSGFSNSAVVTVWAMFIISGALYRSGIANMIGNRVLGLAGGGEKRLLVTIMLTAGILSAFMNNVGVAALLLPVVMDISRKTKIAPSKLLMPLAIGCLLGGMTTLIGTPPNILASEALASYDFEPFKFFDFTPIGTALLVAGILFTVLVGRFLLPKKDISKEIRETSAQGLEQIYDIKQDLYLVKVPDGSILSGKTIADSRFGTMLGLNVIGIIRDRNTRLAPSPEAVIQSKDQLIVSGSLDQLSQISNRQHLVSEAVSLNLEDLVSEEIEIKEVKISPSSKLIGSTVIDSNFRQRFGCVVLSLQRGDQVFPSTFDQIPLQKDDCLLIYGDKTAIDRLQNLPDFEIASDGGDQFYHLRERLIAVCVSENSTLVGTPIAESRLAEAFNLSVMGIVRDSTTHLIPTPDEILQSGDILFIKGKQENIELLQAFQELEIEGEQVPEVSELESEKVGMIEAALSPHTSLNGKTLEQIHFREKFGLSVIGVYRSGKAYRTNLREMPLEFGDALLLFGRRERLSVLGSEPDFLVLTEEVQEAPKTNKAPISALILAGVVLSVLVFDIQIAIAAVIGAALMVLSRTITMDEAYRFIDWRSVFLIAGLIPLGIAMESTGAANYIASNVISRIGDFGTIAVMAGVFVLTSLGSQVMPNAVVTVLMAPIAINTATDLHVSPQSLMMVVAIAASAAFMSPVAHPANILVMGPGGYKVKDYIKVGLPLTILVLIIVLLLLPIFWPL